MVAGFVSSGVRLLVILAVRFTLIIVERRVHSSKICTIDQSGTEQPVSRGVRSNGKSDKQGFYNAALWLHKYHPNTLACNLKYIVDFGYFKDLPEILYRILQGPDAQKPDGSKRVGNQKPKRGGFGGIQKPIDLFGGGNRKRGKKSSITSSTSSFDLLTNKRGKRQPMSSTRQKRLKVERIEKLKAERQATREARTEAENMKVKSEVEKAREKRNERKVDMAKKAIEKGRLIWRRRQLKALKSGEVRRVSLASKWCPSLDSAYDRAIVLCASIARRVFPRDAYPEYEGVEEAYYSYRVRDRLRKEVLALQKEKSAEKHKAAKGIYHP